MAQIKYKLGDLSKEKYSTDEIVIGEWIDGKPIYRKTWTGTGNPNSFNHNIDSLGDVIKIDGCFLNGSSQWMNFSGADSESGLYSCRAMVTATQIVFSLRYLSMTKYTLSVEYTKTTDA